MNIVYNIGSKCCKMRKLLWRENDGGFKRIKENKEKIW